MFGLPSFLEPTRREVAPLHAATMATIIITILSIASALATRAIYDRVLAYHSWESLIGVGIGMLLIIALDFVLRMLRTHLTESAGHSYELRVADSMFGRLMATAGINSSYAVSMLGRLDSVRDMWSGALVSSYVEISSAGIVLFAMYWISMPAGLTATVGLVLMAVMTGWAQHRMMSSSTDMDNAFARRQGLFVECMLGREDLISCRALGTAATKMRSLSAGSAAASRRQRDLGGLSMSANAALQMLTSNGVMIATAAAVLLSDGSTGTMIACSILWGRLAAPVGALAGNALKIARGRAAADALRRFDGPTVRSGTWVPKGPTAPTVAFEGVTVKFPGCPKPVLKDVSFVAAPGEIIAIIGKTGIGKSTMGRLIGGLMLPTDGHVRLAGTSTAAWSEDALHGFSHYCGQDAFLFSDLTLGDNVRLARPHATDAEVERALSAVGAAELFKGHPDGLARPIGERAANLSGGQRRQVTVARALLSDSKVLVLDECTTGMDEGAVRNFVVTLHGQGWLKGRTVFLITHGTALLQLAHRVIEIHDGAIIIKKRQELFRDGKLANINFIPETQPVANAA